MLLGCFFFLATFNILYSVWLVFYYVTWGLTFLVQSIRCSVYFYFDSHPFFKLGKFPSMILLKIFYRPLSWVSSPSFILVSLRFVFFFLHSVPDFLNILCQGFCSWDKATTVGREVRRRKSMRCTGKAAASVPLRSWG